MADVPVDRRRHWRRVWREKEESAVSWFEPHPALSLALIEAAGVGPEDAIIDVGGGASRLVDALLERGFRDLTVLDLAEEALARARARLGARAQAVHWIVADVTRWRPPRRYRLWHDRAVFHFLVEEPDRARYLEVLAGALEPGGQVVIATFAPDAPPRCSGLPVRRWSAEELAGAFGAGFRLAEHRRQVHTTPGGVVQPFTWLRLERIA